MRESVFNSTVLTMIKRFFVCLVSVVMYMDSVIYVNIEINNPLLKKNSLIHFVYYLEFLYCALILCAIKHLHRLDRHNYRSLLSQIRC